MARGIEGWLKSQFSLGKFRAISEKQQYDPSLDEGIYHQMTGKREEIVEVYLQVGDTWEFICDIRESQSQATAYINVMNGLNRVKENFENRTHLK